jgi:hypothetical protein
LVGTVRKAIQNEATAFVVYVGSGGVMNWVEAAPRRLESGGR